MAVPIVNDVGKNIYESSSVDFIESVFNGNFVSVFRLLDFMGRTNSNLAGDKRIVISLSRRSADCWEGSADPMSEKSPRRKRNALVRACERRGFIDIPGVVRTSYIDGSYLLETPSGGQYEISAAGDIEGDVPTILRVEIENLALVVRHDVTTVFQTISHTMHFVGGGVFSYLHWDDAVGVSFRSEKIMWRMPEDGVFIVCGTALDAV